MPISGLVITLDSNEDAAQRAIRQIDARPTFEAGVRQRHRLPVVLETPDRGTDKREWQWLGDLGGVVHVDVVFVHFESSESDASQAPERGAMPTAMET